MDIFDVAILILVFGLVFKKFISEKVYLISIILAVLTAFSQIFIVGYKWQYTLLYVIIFISALNFITGFKLNNKILKSISFLLLFTFFLSSVLFIYFLPIPKFTIEDGIVELIKGYELITTFKNKDFTNL